MKFGTTFKTGMIAAGVAANAIANRESRPSVFIGRTLPGSGLAVKGVGRIRKTARFEQV